MVFRHQEKWIVTKPALAVPLVQNSSAAILFHAGDDFAAGIRQCKMTNILRTTLVLWHVREFFQQ